MTILFRPQGAFGWFSYTTSRDTIRCVVFNNDERHYISSRVVAKAYQKRGNFPHVVRIDLTAKSCVIRYALDLRNLSWLVGALSGCRNSLKPALTSKIKLTDHRGAAPDRATGHWLMRDVPHSGREIEKFFRKGRTQKSPVVSDWAFSFQ